MILNRILLQVHLLNRLKRKCREVNAHKFQQTALHLACYVGKAPAIVAFLAELYGPEAVNAKQAKGMTALDCAREKGHEDAAAVLAARGGKAAAELDAAGEPEATKKPKSATKGNAGAVVGRE